jgi:hypothetical protein
MSTTAVASIAAEQNAGAPENFVPASGPSPAETSRLAEVGGVEIADIDLAQPLSPEQCAWIVQTFRTHPILVFRGQHLSKDQQYAFTLNFGEIEDQHVNRLVDSARYAAVHMVSNLDRDGRPSETPALLAPNHLVAAAVFAAPCLSAFLDQEPDDTE